MKKICFIIVLMLVISLILASCAPKDKGPSQPVPQDNSIEQPGAAGDHEDPEGDNNDSAQDNTAADKADYGVYPGDKAYDFKLKDLEGNEVSLSDYQGKTIIITFWQTTCSWCGKELPLLDKLYKTYKDEDLVVFAVNIAEDEARVKQEIEDKGFTFQVLLDSKADVTKKYLISALPTSFIISRKGIISAMHIGYMEYSQMEAYADAAFKEM